jgi:hypothetical protein
MVRRLMVEDTPGRLRALVEADINRAACYWCGVCVGIRVFVEPKALFHVVGTTMDFQVRPMSVNIISRG